MRWHLLRRPSLLYHKVTPGSFGSSLLPSLGLTGPAEVMEGVWALLSEWAWFVGWKQMGGHTEPSQWSPLVLRTYAGPGSLHSPLSSLLPPTSCGQV